MLIPEVVPTGWRAELTLGFEARDARTILAERRHNGPLLVQQPFYPEDAVCHVYVIHPPGGVVGGDILNLDITNRQASKALVTTPAAGKFYRSNGKPASQNIHLHIDGDAELEWLPQENIFFDGAIVRNTIQVDLAQNARFIGWELASLGRPLCGEHFNTGKVSMQIEIRKDKKPLLIERMLLNAETIHERAGMNAHPLLATMVALPSEQKTLDAAREAAGESTFFGATLLDDLLVCRMVGEQAEPVRRVFTNIWNAIRPMILNRQACPPRIWAT